jgi:hypothetical protein
MGAQELFLLEDSEPAVNATTRYDLIAAMCAQRKAELEKIEYVSHVVQSDAYSEALTHFNSAAAQQSRKGHGSFGTLSKGLFDVEPARRALDAVYWGKTLALTDIMDCMPAKRRTEWKEQIYAGDCPEFVEENVRATIQALMADRDKFFAERVDGVFQGLSSDHVTNIPSGFRVRMILAYIFDDHGISHRNAGVICDLRAVVARIMKRGEPVHTLTEKALSEARNHAPGEWHELDGGAIRFKCFMIGTVHIQVDEEIAYELNSVLAALYPNAIPSEFRERPKRRVKRPRMFCLEQKRLPFGVLNLIANMEPKPSCGNWSCELNNYLGADKITVTEARRLLESIGGVRLYNTSDYYNFDYDPTQVLRAIMDCGSIPEHKSHQYYPTPESIGKEAAQKLDPQDGEDFLEPNAGQGNLAQFLPKMTTLAVEISALHCKILEQKGYTVVHADFLAWAKTTPKRFSKILMNPPYSQGRAQMHVEAAATLLKSKGRLVAVLPESMRGKDFLPGFDHEWSQLYENEFDGTGVSTVILTANRRT